MGQGIFHKDIEYEHCLRYENYDHSLYIFLAHFMNSFV